MFLYNISSRARRKVYVLILIITCLFIISFKISQNYLVLSPNAFFDCPACSDRLQSDQSTNLSKETNSLKGHGGEFKTLVKTFQTLSENKMMILNDANRDLDLHLKKSNSRTPKESDPHQDDNDSDSKKSIFKFDPAGDSPSGKRNRYKPPVNEEQKRRFPQCVIIGFAKCGTRALLDFMALHPYIVHHPSEVHFYDMDENFDKGFDWYKNKMPLSYSNQITLEKTPEYIMSQRARDEMYKLTPDVKLIILVRDPVIRLVSQYLLSYRNVLPNQTNPVTVVYRNKYTGQFDPKYKPVVKGIYYTHFAMWLERFPRRQFLIANGEQLSADPLPVLKDVESFLGIPPMFQEQNFYFNKSSGFFCPMGFEEGAKPKCLGKLKGFKHPKLPADDEKMLYNFYRPWNEKFFQLARKRFDWKEREWERYQ